MSEREIDSSQFVSQEKAPQDYRDEGIRGLVEALRQRLKDLPEYEQFSRQLDGMVAAIETAHGRVSETADARSAPPVLRPHGESADAAIPDQSISMNGELWAVRPMPTKGLQQSDYFRGFHDLRDSVQLNMLGILRYTDRRGSEWLKLEAGLSQFFEQRGLKPSLALLNNSVLIMGDGETNRVLALPLPNHSLEELGPLADWFQQKDVDGAQIDQSSKSLYEISAGSQRVWVEPAVATFNRDESNSVV